MTRKFIVLEKDDDLRSLYGRKLTQTFEGCVVFEAASCAEAVARMNHASVDAIVVNQAALDARGIEMVRAIRRVNADVPLVSICDLPQAEDALQNGADAFVATEKWEELGSAVEQVLAQRNGRN